MDIWQRLMVQSDHLCFSRNLRTVSADLLFQEPGGVNFRNGLSVKGFTQKETGVKQSGAAPVDIGFFLCANLVVAGLLPMMVKKSTQPLHFVGADDTIKSILRNSSGRRENEYKNGR